MAGMGKAGGGLFAAINAVADVLEQAPTILGNAYANGSRGKPAIVAAHYTPGNSDRYGWPPLSQRYFAWKQGMVSDQVKPLSLAKAKTHRGTKLDDNASFSSSTGTVTGFGRGKNLPMLVGPDRPEAGGMHEGGTLKRAVSEYRKHPVTQSGDAGVITFVNLPDYALAHENGIRVPRRSPVDPNQDDVDACEDVLRDAVSKAVGKLSQAAPAAAPVIGPTGVTAPAIGPTSVV